MAVTITRTPIVDDDGSGTTGTPLDNAWKQELYGQIDGLAAALGGSMGQWLSFPYTPAILTAATGTATTQAAYFNYLYCVVGKVGFINASIGPVTTSAATAWVRIAWPPGFGPLLANANVIDTLNAGTLVATTVNVSATSGLSWFASVALTGTIPATANLYLHLATFFAVP